MFSDDDDDDEYRFSKFSERLAKCLSRFRRVRLMTKPLIYFGGAPLARLGVKKDNDKIFRPLD